MSTIAKSIYLFLLVASLRATAQDTQSIELAYDKTSTLIFPSVIHSVDRGSSDLLAQKVNGLENVLQLKAARAGFPETNLTVITADGVIHHFMIRYSSEPALLVVNLSGDGTHDSGALNELLFETGLTETDIGNCAQRIVRQKRTIRFVRKRNYKIGLSLRGIYVHDNLVFYHLRLKNASNIRYDVDFLRFYIRDKKKAKRTASQEINLVADCIYGDSRAVVGNTTEDLVYLTEKITIPEAKHLIIEVFEKNGGRNLALAIRNGRLVRAKLLK